MTEIIDTRAPQRVRHEARRRLLTVTDVTDITPLMRRVRLEGDMAGFASLGYADHIKTFLFPEGTVPALPQDGEFAAENMPEMRDYTPRYWNVEDGWIEIDFVLHGTGPAASWAASAAPGNTLVIGGPRGSLVVPTTFDWFLLAGDETALPAIGRRIEELPSGARVLAVIEIENAAEEQQFETSADLTMVYVHRNGAPAGTTTLVCDTLAAQTFPAGEAYAFIAGEVTMSRTVRDHLVDQRGFNPQYIKAAGYWRLGVADAHEEH